MKKITININRYQTVFPPFVYFPDRSILFIDFFHQESDFYEFNYDIGDLSLGDFVIIAHEEDNLIGVSKSNGAIFSLSMTDPKNTRYINRNFSYLMQSLDAYILFDVEINSDKTETKKLFYIGQKLKKILETIDSTVFNTVENWWAVYIEYLEDNSTGIDEDENDELMFFND